MIRNIFFDRVLSKKIFSTKTVRNKSIFNNEMASLGQSKKLTSYNKKLKNNYIAKSSIVIKALIGERVFVHIGKEIISMKITPGMVDYKLGEFFFNKKSVK
jgi:ribosomal protein S19